MIDFISNLITGNYNAKTIQKMQPIVQHINSLYADYDQLSDDQIKAKTDEFKTRYADGESLDDMLPEAYAVVKQACKRMCGKSYEVKGEQVERKMIPYDVQLIGAIALHRKTIAEMKTGEGKTLVAAMPVYLNALTGKGVHVVTVNDYLASRDAERIGHLYQWLGLTVGTVVKGVDLKIRRQQYACDITYVENSELGFDYLRDNLVKSKAERNLLWRPLHYAIIDEVDSILIDEARTPLIISHPADEPTEKYLYYAKIARSLTAAKGKKKISKGFLHERINDVKEGEKETNAEDQSGDYFVDEKNKTALLSSTGIAKLEKMLSVDNLYKDLGYDEIHHIENALKATAVYRKDKEYIVSNGEVMIVDQHTGRAMKGRRFSQGLHQAIEAKEGLTIQRESKTMATITYQNFFKQYEKLAGMTGTATTEGEEFEKIYELEVLAIPTNKPILRVDHADKVYFSQNAKRKHALDYISFAHEAGQPILIGTSAIHTSEYVSKLLRKQNIVHTVLNAKFHEQEAKIVANAGKQGSVVVATNMAGRGTDIKLDPSLNPTLATNYARWAQQHISGKDPQIVSLAVYSSIEFEWLIDAFQETFGRTEDQTTAAYQDWVSSDDQKLARRIKLNTKKDSKKDPYNRQAFAEIIIRDPSVPDLEMVEKECHFGLMVLATEKHDSRRIDNQLRGRAGRQGDPGVSIFMVALDDDIMQKVGGEKIKSMASLLLSTEELEDMELTQKQFASSIERAQKQMEARHFSIRKHLFDYDSVVDKQRHKIYAKRDMMLEALDAAEQEDSIESVDDGSPVIVEITTLIPKVVHEVVNKYELMQTPLAEVETTLQKEFNTTLTTTEIEQLQSDDQLADSITEHLTNHISTVQDKLASPVLNRILAGTYLNVIDRYWVEHIDAMKNLRDKVGLMSYAQQEPLVVYKKEAYERFTALNTNIRRETVVSIANIDRDRLQERYSAAAQAQKAQHQALMDKLKQVAATAPNAMAAVNQLLGAASQAAPTGGVAHAKAFTNDQGEKVIYQDEDGFEVIEMSGGAPSNPSPHAGQGRAADPEPASPPTRAKLRPNDKVNVRHPDGKITYDVKYKKVKTDIEKGNLTLI